MTILPSSPAKLLAMLEEDSPMPGECQPSDVERLPLDVVVARLHELGVDPAMPGRLRNLVGGRSGPADRLLSLVDEEHDLSPASVEQRPRSEVIAALEQLGIDHAAGVSQIRETLDRVKPNVAAARATVGMGASGVEGAIRVSVEGSRRLYDVGEPIRLSPNQAGAVVTVVNEDGLPLATFTLPAAACEVELDHPGPPRVRLSVRNGTAVVQREVVAGDLALFDNARWLRCHWVVALVLAVGWMIVGAQVMLIETVHGAFASATYVYAVAIYLLGTILGAIFFGWLADRVGRKPVYTVTALIYVATGFATTLFPADLHGFAALRFLVGVATGGEYVVLSTALQELMPKRRRGWACLAISGSFWLGLTAVELISPFPETVMDRWQAMFWTVGVLGAVLLGLRWFLPESPRWLIAHCRKDRQTDTMLNELRKDLANHPERPTAAGPQLLVPARVLNLSLIGLMWGEYRQRTLVCLALLCSQAFFYNAFSFRFSHMLEILYGGKEGPISDNHLVYYVAAANFAGPLFLGWCFDKIGRKTMIWSSYMISGCLLLGVSMLLLLDYLPPSSIQMTITWAIVFFFTSTAAGSAYLTAGESFPVEIRATTFSLLFGVAMLVGLIGSLLYGWLTGDLQQAQGMRQGWDVQQHERVALCALGVLAGAAMAAAAVVEKAIGTEYAQSSLEEHAPSLSQGAPHSLLKRAR